jgi:hypothetical protein
MGWPAAVVWSVFMVCTAVVLVAVIKSGFEINFKDDDDV